MGKYLLKGRPIGDSRIPPWAGVGQEFEADLSSTDEKELTDSGAIEPTAGTKAARTRAKSESKPAAKLEQAAETIKDKAKQAVETIKDKVTPDEPARQERKASIDTSAQVKAEAPPVSQTQTQNKAQAPPASRPTQTRSKSARSKG